ncbi:hypothetical protein JJJ17_04235 [Paracoccus caeni]|uniref:DUF2066 domain-containing protein n=1 Tax=Paracoccus caeni TaxID=657651 RepID=A0A934SIM0_9RHOB|nr:hypothetical protein [Paracoccus caeni]MBK4215128.1 hypothetical protein [Paracoccus caeni]
MIDYRPMMLKTLSTSVSALLLSLATPVLADSDPLTEADCRAPVELMQSSFAGSDEGVSVTFEALEDGVCIYRDLVMKTGQPYGSSVVASRIRIEGDGLRWAAAYLKALALPDPEARNHALTGITLMPERLKLQVTGMRQVLYTDDSYFDYALEAQSRMSMATLVLDIGWDQAAKELQLHQAGIEMPHGNMVRVSGVVKDVDLSSLATMQMSLSGFAVTELDAEIRSYGLFQAYALPMLAMAVIVREEEQAPELQMEMALKQALAAVDQLPAESVPDESKLALRNLISDLPDLWGVLKLNFRADPGFGPVRLGRFALMGPPEGIEDVLPLFQGVRLDVDWQQETAPWKVEGCVTLQC